MYDDVSLNNTVLQEFPYPVARRYDQLLKADSPEVRIRHALAVFEVGLRSLTLAMLGQYVHRDLRVINSPKLNKEALGLLSRPASPGTWNRVFFTALDAYKDFRNRFFMTELYDFYWDTSTKTAQPKKGVQHPFQEMVALRNVFHHNPPATPERWRMMDEQVETLLTVVLSQFTFLTSYDLVYLAEQEGQMCVYDVYTGLEIKRVSSSLQARTQLQEKWCYLSKTTGELLPIHPWIILLEKDLQDDLNSTEVAVYDSYNEPVLSYWSTHGMVKLDSINAPQLLNTFIELVVERLREAYRPQREVYRLSWHDLKALSEQIVAQRLGDERRRYSPRVYLQRQEMRGLFEEFLQDEATALVLTGASGVGKSSFVMSLLKEFRESESVCALAYNGGRLEPNVPIDELLAHDFNLYLNFRGQEPPDGPAVMKLIDEVDTMGERHLVIFIDAINENPHGRAVLRRVDRFIESYPYSWLKVVVTSRPEAWRSIKKGVRLAEHRYFEPRHRESLELELTGFNEEGSEPSAEAELQLAYEKYQRVYDLKTPYSEIPIRIKRLLQNPLTLLLVAETYAGGEIDEDVRTSELIGRYVDKLKETDRLEERDLRFLRQEIVPRMFEPPYRTRLTQREIENERSSDGRSLYEYIYNEDPLPGGRQVNQSYTNLVDSDILREQGPPEYDVSFEYERFFDYFGGRRIQWLAESSQLPRAEYYLKWILTTVEEPFLWGSVQEALLLELRRGDWAFTTDLSQTKERAAKEMMVAVLREFSVDNRATVKAILRDLTSTTREYQPDFRKRLLAWEDVEQGPAALNAQKVAVEVAGNIEDLDILELAGISRSPTVRIHAIRQILRLWRKEQSGQTGAATHEASLEVIRRIVDHIGDGRIPNKHAVETSAVALLYILAETYPEFSQGNKAELAHELRQIARRGLESLLGIRRTARGDARPTRLRTLFMSLLVRVTRGWTDDAPEHNTVSSTNLETYFAMPQRDKEAMLLLLPHLDPEKKDLSELEENLSHIVDLNDTIINYTLRFVLIAQWEGNREGVLRIVRLLMATRGEEEVPSYSGIVALSALGNIVAQGRGDEEAVQVLLEGYEWMLESAKGRVRFSGGIYALSGLDLLFRAIYGFQGSIPTDMVQRHVARAIYEGDVEFLNSVLHTCGLLFQEKEFHSPLFEVLRPILAYNNDAVQASLGNLLARFYHYYPNEVEDFLMRNDYPPEMVRQVKYREVEAVIGGDFLADRLNGFLADSAARSEKMRRAMAHVMYHAVSCRNLNQFIDRILETIINLGYGDPVFDHGDNYLF